MAAPPNYACVAKLRLSTCLLDRIQRDCTISILDLYSFGCLTATRQLGAPFAPHTPADVEKHTRHQIQPQVIVAAVDVVVVLVFAVVAPNFAVVVPAPIAAAAVTVHVIPAVVVVVDVVDEHVDDQNH